jgi:uncharacterized protein YjbJ (UPF0337 family)
MNWDQIEGQWKNFKGKVREQWGKLTDDDLESIAGKKDRLLGTLQSRYGKKKDKLEKEVDKFISGIKNTSKKNKH